MVEQAYDPSTPGPRQEDRGFSASLGYTVKSYLKQTKLAGEGAGF